MFFTSEVEEFLLLRETVKRCPRWSMKTSQWSLQSQWSKYLGQSQKGGDVQRKVRRRDSQHVKVGSKVFHKARWETFSMKQEWGVMSPLNRRNGVTTSSEQGGSADSSAVKATFKVEQGGIVTSGAEQRDGP